MRSAVVALVVTAAVAASSLAGAAPAARAAGVSIPPSPDDESRCAALANARVRDVRVDRAAFVRPAPKWTSPPGLGRPVDVTTPFCRVEGTIEGRIGFELWLPPAIAWNGRLLGAGVGGDAGVFNYRDLARGVAAGFAAVTNDSGHKASEKQWMLRREAVADYTHRSQHLMNVAARGLVAAHFAKPPDRAYFIGCSGGGRQALKEIQRYPQDYDGVIAGAPAPAMPEMSARHMIHGLHQQRRPEGALDDAAWDLVVEAAAKTCDGRDGVEDGVVERPLECPFDPGTLTCDATRTTKCLTPVQVDTVRFFYAPLRDESGRARDSGLVPGVRTRPGPPSPLLVAMFALGAHRDPSWAPERFSIEKDLALVQRTMPDLRADDPDLRAFARRGGKAIVYNGWLDPSVSATNTLDWVSKARQQYPQAADASLRVYMVPGLFHCAGGPGVQNFGGSGSPLPIGAADRDLLSALIDWVENAREPRAIVGTRTDPSGTVMRERLLCPHPQYARYRGGPSEAAASYECTSP